MAIQAGCALRAAYPLASIVYSLKRLVLIGLQACCFLAECIVEALYVLFYDLGWSGIL